METYARFQTGHNEFEADCTVCILRTFVSVANKGSLDFDAQRETTKHIMNIQGESSSSKITKQACTQN
jgi:hypothetical protein